MKHASVSLVCERCNKLTAHSFVMDNLFWCRICYRSQRNPSEEEMLLQNGMCPCGSESYEGCSVTGCPLYCYQELRDETYQGTQD